MCVIVFNEIKYKFRHDDKVIMLVGATLNIEVNLAWKRSV